MTEYIDRRKLIENLAPILYEKGVVVNNTVSRIIYGIQCEDTADVVEREKINKAINEAYKIRDEVLHDNDYYESNDVLDIIDEITKLFEEL